MRTIQAVGSKIIFVQSMNEGSVYKTSEFWAFLVKLTMQKNSCSPTSEGQTKQLRENNRTRTFFITILPLTLAGFW